MSDILAGILDVKRREVVAARACLPLEHLQEKANHLPKCRNFYRTMTKSHPGRINVIAEIKRASPSAGLMRPDFDPVELAEIYKNAGADAISVLTDEQFFQGRLEFLTQVKQAVDLPVLGKDFIIDPYQIYQARLAGADAVLLIAEALDAATLMDLMILATSLTLTVLLEVHELDTLLKIRSMIGFPLPHYSLLGINNRNLKTMEVDPAHSLRLGEFFDNKTELISESGIRQRRDVQRLIDAQFNGVLIGETLMRSRDINAKFTELFDPDRERKNE